MDKEEEALDFLVQSMRNSDYSMVEVISAGEVLQKLIDSQKEALSAAVNKGPLLDALAAIKHYTILNENGQMMFEDDMAVAIHTLTEFIKELD